MRSGRILREMKQITLKKRQYRAIAPKESKNHIIQHLYRRGFKGAVRKCRNSLEKRVLKKPFFFSDWQFSQLFTLGTISTQPSSKEELSISYPAPITLTLAQNNLQGWINLFRPFYRNRQPCFSSTTPHPLLPQTSPRLACKLRGGKKTCFEKHPLPLGLGSQIHSTKGKRDSIPVNIWMK